eukprot:GHVR01160187.1.p1 GENE.GHVR01160187.1~~GHVR01160187.1.p1  ORF type:complete len:141 (+),score=9.69 GHVR01160187.1:1-423(+)
MKNVSAGEKVTKDILTRYWDRYWIFIENLVGGTILTNTIYFDLRPEMSNVLFLNDSFILMDLESFQGFPRDEDSMSPFPRMGVCSVVWTLWQAIACVWCVSRGCKENELYTVHDKKTRVPLTSVEGTPFFDGLLLFLLSL